ncbi:MAG: Uma2 family endonuclease [Gemmataceae bacterium]
MVVIPPELRALEDSAADRWIIDGQRFDWPHSVRGRREAIAFTRIRLALARWADGDSDPRDVVLTDVGCWLSCDPVTALDPPISVIAAETAARTAPNECWIAGVPRLAVEFAGPHRHPAWGQRTGAYLACGVRVVWVVETDLRTVAVYKPGVPPVLYDPTQTISGDPDLPGFSARVADFFR